VTLRSGHGHRAGTGPRVEVLPADELPAGVPVAAHQESPRDRGKAGRFAPGNTLSRAGGLAKRGTSRLTNRLGLSNLSAGDAFAPYRKSASTFRRVQCAELARTVGGGVCGPGPCSVVASAALALAWSRFLSDEAARTGDPDLALRSSRLGETSRQHLLAAHELCAREALARAKQRTTDQKVALRDRILGPRDEPPALPPTPSPETAPAEETRDDEPS
jgi:hypothetical protein